MTVHFDFVKTGTNQYLFSLENGLRVIYTQNPNTLLVHCGFLVGAGSRDETRHNNGMAHFIEHTVFKGTDKRKASQVFDYLETVGGDLNAYTTREKTFFYASVLKKYMDRAADLLTDIVFMPVFPDEEIKKEKNVIIEEIEMYKDSPEESIYDDFHASVFGKNTLALTILGTKESLGRIGKKEIAEFRNSNYTTDNIIFSVVGNLEIKELEKVFNRHFAAISVSVKTKTKKSSVDYRPFNIEKTKKFQQVHCIIGNVAYSIHDNRKYSLMVLNNLLGGEWMSSKLNMILREKHAFVYNISSNVNVYSDTGIFTIQFGTDEKYLKKCIQLINKELDKLRSGKISQSMLNRTKRQISGHFAAVEESNNYIMQSQARNMLDFGRVITRKEFFDHLENVTADDLMETANIIFESKNLSKMIFTSSKK